MNTEQLTLGELIEKIQPIADRQEAVITKYEPPATVQFDFGSALPTGFGSYRGYYEQLAIHYSFNGYGSMQGYTKDSGLTTHEPKPMDVITFLQKLKELNGKVFTGWKGGEFEMNLETPLWVSNTGDSDETAVIDVIDDEYRVILVTRYMSWF